MDLGHIGSVGTTIGGGFFGGILIGYALKKVVKIIAIVVGLFFAGIAYLQYQQILNINWNKLQEMSEMSGDVTKLVINTRKFNYADFRF